MVSLSAVHKSNALISTSFPPGLVGVFVGATSGIGEVSLKAFVKEAVRPRCYFVGRSQEAADRIIEECKQLNDGAELIFLKADLTLIKNTDDVCEQIKTRESSINILFLSSGALYLDWPITSERLPTMVALAFHSRYRITQQMLPLLQNAKHLSRVVSVAGGGKEGYIYRDDLAGFNIPFIYLRGHLISIITLSMEALASRAPEVSFINTFPGFVKTPLFSKAGGAGVVLKAANWVLLNVMGPFMAVPIEESAARHLFLATSSRYVARKGKEGDAASGVPLASGEVEVARGTDGEVGSGVYSIDWNGESSPKKVEVLLKGYRDEGMVEKIWQYCEDEFKRIKALY